MQAIFTDLDGTLINSKLANIAAYKEAINSFSLSYDNEKLECYIGVLPWIEMLRQVLPNVDYSVHEEIAKLKRKIYPNFFNLIKLNDTLVSILQIIHTHLPIGLVTSASRDSTMPLLQDKQLIHLFNVILTADDCKLHKPAPQPYLQAAQLLNVDIKKCLILEDSSVGVESGHLAGAQVWKVLLNKDGLF